ncbi:DUF4232 domain-containing protein [Streptodolium elevatio]
MFGHRRKALLVSAALVSSAMLLTACNGSDSGAAQGSSSAAQPGAAVPPSNAPAPGNGQGAGASDSGTNGNGQAPAPAGKPSGAQGTAAGSGAGAGAGTSAGAGAGTSGGADGSIGKCRTDDLKITAMDATITGDPNGTVAVTFENIGHNCTMSGYAGVDLKTAAGSVSAQRIGQPAEPMVLQSGKSVSFGIDYPINDSGGSGVRITDLLVTPPGETKSITLKWPGGGSLPVTDGSGTPVQVGPIGSAGQGG